MLRRYHIMQQSANFPPAATSSHPAHRSPHRNGTPFRIQYTPPFHQPPSSPNFHIHRVSYAPPHQLPADWQPKPEGNFHPKATSAHPDMFSARIGLPPPPSEDHCTPNIFHWHPHLNSPKERSRFPAGMFPPRS